MSNNSNNDHFHTGFYRPVLTANRLEQRAAHQLEPSTDKGFIRSEALL
jgi:hypothetical protein